MSDGATAPVVAGAAGQPQDPLVAAEIAAGSVITDETMAKEIADYLTVELQEVFGGKERKAMEEDWKKWRRQREARPAQRTKTFPWPGASNVCPPLAMYNTNGIYAMLKASTGDKKPVWDVAPQDPQYNNEAVGWAAFLGLLAESPYHANLRGALNHILYELASMGTQFVQIPWIIERWNFKRQVPGGPVEAVSKVSRDCPQVIPITLEDFGTRSHWADIQKAPWIAIRTWLYDYELKQRVVQGVYPQDKVDAVLGRSSDAVTEARKTELDQMGLTTQTGDTHTYAVYQVYLFWDVDGDGAPEDIKIWFDPLTQTILRSEFNDLGIRDVVRIVYIPRPGELYGIGVGWMVEHAQDEIEALHNMRVDGTMLAMLQMYVTRRGSGVAEQEDFHPLKNIAVDNPREDFLPVKFPDIGYGTIQAEMIIKEYAERVTGASDAMMGYESRSTSARTTFGGTQFLASQGTKMFNSVKEGVDESFGAMGQLMTYQLIRNADRAQALVALMPEESQQAVKNVLTQFKVEDIPSTFRFQVQSTDIEQTEEAKRQIKLTLTQLYTQYGKEIFGIIPIVYNPQTPEPVKEIATKFYVGATKLMDNVFQSFGERQTADYLPYVHDLEMLLDALDLMKESKLKQTVRGGVGNGSNSQGAGGSPFGGPTTGAPPGGTPFGGPADGGGVAPPTPLNPTAPGTANSPANGL